ncbi:MAG: cobalt-zinc-cadmium resistance protein [Burkholderiales bacterium]|nr:cobalt-zinc-cadmium resistance protein [Burkholderiales bacterium]
MRKFLIIFLLAWMPTQLAWAAISVYCKHEPAQSNQSAHPGHHEHEHAAAADTGTPPDAGGAHPDCSVCHGVAGISVAAPAAPDLNSQADVTDALRFIPPAPPPAQPERPKWSPA